MTGCLDEQDCIITSTNLVKINFKIDSKTARVISFTKINVSGLTKDFYSGASVSSLQLPVSPDDNEATFTFEFEGRTETMHLTYTRQSEVVSPSCGAFTNYSGLSVSESSFELFTLTNRQLVINAASNLEVFVE